MGVLCKYVHVVFWLTYMDISVRFYYRFTGGKNVSVFTFTVETVDQLLVAIGTCCPSPAIEGPVVVKIWLPDGRFILGSYYVDGPKSKKPDVETIHFRYIDFTWFTPLVTRLLTEGTPFVTKIHEENFMYVLEWTIYDNPETK